MSAAKIRFLIETTKEIAENLQAGTACAYRQAPYTSSISGHPSTDKL